MAEVRWLMIPIEGPLQIVRPGDDSYGLLSGSVGGYIQSVPLQGLNKVNIWLHEEGKLIGLPHNPRAQLIWENSYGHTDIMVGPAVLTGGADEEGETLGLTHTELRMLASIALQTSTEGHQDMDAILKAYGS